MRGKGHPGHAEREGNNSMEQSNLYILGRHPVIHQSTGVFVTASHAMQMHLNMRPTRNVHSFQKKSSNCLWPFGICAAARVNPEAVHVPNVGAHLVYVSS